jgi:hypothetical protein
MKKNIREGHLIDNYYNEASSFQESHSEDNELFKEKLEKSLEKMNALEDLDFPMDINILEIVNTAEAIKDKKKLRLESFAFIGVCLIIISAVVLLSLSVDVKIILYTEAAISALLPLTLIPIAKNIKIRGNA